VGEGPATFAGVLRRLRTGIQLTQEELARAANLSVRAVSDLERGVATTPHRDTVRLLADALQLIGPDRADFEAAARGPAPADQASSSIFTTNAGMVADSSRCASSGERKEPDYRPFSFRHAAKSTEVCSSVAG